MKVIMYKSTDGKLHESAGLCDAHNAQIAVIPALKECLSANCNFDQDTGMITKDEAIDFLFKNAPHLVEILTPLLPAKQKTPRKSKQAGADQVTGAAAQSTPV